ncbi:CrcB family protein [uncultured Streptomyces sp.]|uniref:FluC/FEX family fluoride channel n=1 Tax=uncultured Streptomyces sp. TaxID=174707 RepID=UPI00260379B3|nr:CrcB family protein [uncultured Streptomyces sp.]
MSPAAPAPQGPDDDPAADPHGPAPGGTWPVLAAVSAGGALGTAARYAATLAWPTAPDAFPWTVFAVNVTGCALIGVLMALVAERAVPAHPLVRPFLGVGVLGGFTTFSTYAADVSKLLARQEVLTALAYAGATVAAALGAVWAATTATRAAVDRGRRAVRAR